eukprot:353356_1
MVDSLIEFTGMTKKEINQKGKDLDNVLNQLHLKLKKLNKSYSKGVTIVGQSVYYDIAWCKLKKDKHYKRFEDISQMFKTGTYRYSLRKEAYALLENSEMNSKFHDPTEDARVSIQLFKKYANNPIQLRKAKEKMQRMRIQGEFPNFRVDCKYKQCPGKCDPRRCWCGQKSARNVTDPDELSKLFYERDVAYVRFHW